MGLKELLDNLKNGVYDGERVDNERNGVSWGVLHQKRYTNKVPGGKIVQIFQWKRERVYPRQEDRGAL